MDPLDLVVDDHHEAGDGSVDGGHSRVADAFRRPGPERILSPGLDQFLWDEAEVAVLPTEMPDLSDVTCILRASFAKAHSVGRTGRRSLNAHRSPEKSNKGRIGRRLLDRDFGPQRAQ